MSEEINARFDRMEAKLDRMADAIVLLARVEERQTSQQGDIKRAFSRIECCESRLVAVERKAGYTAWTVGGGAKLVWIAITAAAASIAALVSRSLG